MLKVGLIGLGFMGRGHLDQYIRLMKEGEPVELVAVCDLDPTRFSNEKETWGNMGDLGQAQYDWDAFRCYTDAREMMEKEELDYLDIAVPTYLHRYYAVMAMEHGLHVLCEKPMSLTEEACEHMEQVARKTGKTLMIAQCLRFWPAYETLKEYVDSGEFGKPTLCYFFRGGPLPSASSPFNWYMDENLSGGCLLDQHVHDVDMVNYLFGLPDAVSCIGVNRVPGSGFDAVSTNYRYGDFLVNAQDDWTMNGVNFSMEYRCNFEKGTIIFRDGKTTVYPKDEEPFVADDKGGDDGYYREIKCFVKRLSGEVPRFMPPVSQPGSTRRTIKLAQAERESARRNGEWISLKD